MADSWICPECTGGKHQNCFGISDVDVVNNPIPCICDLGAHPLRKPIVDSDGIILFNWDDAYVFRVDEGVVRYANVRDFAPIETVHTINLDDDPKFDASPYFKEEGTLIPDLDKVPDGPGIRTESFPELSEEQDVTWFYDYRMRPDAQIIKDFHDVEVMNPQGIWVPAIPYPIKLWFGWVRCHCGKRRFGDHRYQEHYAYAHIMGMDN